MTSSVQGEVRKRVSTGGDERLRKIASVIAATSPDILLLCEVDQCGDGGDDGTIKQFLRKYLTDQQENYPYFYQPAVNTGKPYKQKDNVKNQPDFAQGYGFHHGQYGFALLSRYPICTDEIRSWQKVIWQSMPKNRMPADYYPAWVETQKRISSKSHVMIPVDIGGTRIKLIACHPTPPVFDGDEKRNYSRNADELRLIRDMIEGADYLCDDGECSDPIEPPFVILGDLNADQYFGDGDREEIGRLLTHPAIHKATATGHLVPASHRAKRHAGRIAKGNPFATHESGLRLDYILPSAEISPLDSRVVWSANDLPRPREADGTADFSTNGSDHRLVWVDIDPKSLNLG
ncbi:hypothetical protein A8L45_20180 [Veronia pacifica]|uniref:Endonuclease/exonuclease/phosphatase domain-containing protein n=2 Tax=Veronia pacifica TaxID=1080227 RepID=A0A1C3EB67_9GAMM|nr:hypothetical protein A8L45_20180 [Veronia pacifica]